jgi:hypothetical protein
MPATFRQVEKQAGGAGGQGRHIVSERDTRTIIRQWEREIDAEQGREAARGQHDGPWKAVVWGALWCLWVGLLFGIIALIKLH